MGESGRMRKGAETTEGRPRPEGGVKLPSARKLAKSPVEQAGSPMLCLFSMTKRL